MVNVEWSMQGNCLQQCVMILHLLLVLMLDWLCASGGTDEKLDTVLSSSLK
jgi:hypothetical protein